MEVITSNTHCIITPISKKLDLYEAERIKKELNYISGKNTGLNLAYVKDCTIEFLDIIQEFNELSLFNISAEIFTILTLMNFDKKLKLFATEEDFLKSKRQLIARKLHIA